VSEQEKGSYAKHYEPWCEQEKGWQPIETAPKDGTLVIGALIDGGKVWRVHEMRFARIAWYTNSGGGLPKMTHWMPLPEPPADASKG
jgi:hypothetical protein